MDTALRMVEIHTTFEAKDRQYLKGAVREVVPNWLLADKKSIKVPGERVLNLTPGVCVNAFFEEVLYEGFVVVCARYMPLGIPPRCKYQLKVILTPQEFVEGEGIDDIGEITSALSGYFSAFCGKTFAYKNPFVFSDELIPNTYGYSVGVQDLARLLHPDGSPILVKNGSGKIPKKPKHELVFKNGELVLQ